MNAGQREARIGDHTISGAEFEVCHCCFLNVSEGCTRTHEYEFTTGPDPIDMDGMVETLTQTPLVPVEDDEETRSTAPFRGVKQKSPAPGAPTDTAAAPERPNPACRTDGRLVYHQEPPTGQC